MKFRKDTKPGDILIWNDGITYLILNVRNVVDPTLDEKRLYVDILVTNCPNLNTFIATQSWSPNSFRPICKYIECN